MNFITYSKAFASKSGKTVVGKLHQANFHSFLPSVLSQETVLNIFGAYIYQNLSFFLHFIKISKYSLCVSNLPSKQLDNYYATVTDYRIPTYRSTQNKASGLICAASPETVACIKAMQTAASSDLLAPTKSAKLRRNILHDI